MGAINPLHVMFVAAIALLVLGPKRLPEAGRSIGRGLHEFRQALSAHADEDPAAPPRTLDSRPPDAA